MKKLAIALFSLVIPFANILLSQVSLSIDSLSVQAGEEFCVDVAVSNFQNIISFQANFMHDEDLLTFHQFKNAAFPESIDNGLYANDARISWVSKDLINGASLEDHSHLISVCYIAKESGATTISIFDEPTETSWLKYIESEIYNAEEKQVALVVEDGLIIIEEQDPFASKETDLEDNNLTTSVFENDNSAAYLFAPNPVEDILKITSLDTSQKVVSIFSATGNLVASKTTLEQEIFLNTSQLVAGTYLVMVESSANVVTKKLIKL